ncbi:MAG: HTTM domain-containing protein [Burkholderiaceae bacterium]
MTLAAALRLTEVLLALALIQQSLEHVLRCRAGFRIEQTVFAARIVLCAALLAGLATPWPLLALAVLSLLILALFDGPYNGGSDRMGLLTLWCLATAQLVPHPAWQELAFGYLGLQLVLSYLISGLVKLVNPDWRSGRALNDVFVFSAYPWSENLRRLADRPRLLCLAGWAVMLFEILFPLAMLNQRLLLLALLVGGLFHLANACLFGLNRFFWTWLAAYPALIWLQARLV